MPNHVTAECLTKPILVPIGPCFDHEPNGWASVLVERPADTPGFVRCREVGTGKIYVLHRSKLPPGAVVPGAAGGEAR